VIAAVSSLNVFAWCLFSLFHSARSLWALLTFSVYFKSSGERDIQESQRKPRLASTIWKLLFRNVLSDDADDSCLTCAMHLSHVPHIFLPDLANLFSEPTSN
jgi:hypothetical protein